MLIDLDCLQMHADDFRLDRHGVVSALQDGGYSDDMTLAAIAGNGLITYYCSCYFIFVSGWLFIDSEALA